MSERATESRAGSVMETLAMAGSSAASLLLGLARTKIQAIAWGPSGVGAMGLMQAAMSTATIFTGLGVDAVVTRELASTSDPGEQSRIRDAASHGVPLLALGGTALSVVVFLGFATSLGFGSLLESVIVGAGVLLSVVSTNQRAVLSGLRQVRAVAVYGIAAAAVSTTCMAALAALPTSNSVLSLAVIVVPVSLAVCFGAALRRIPRFAPWAGWRSSVGRALIMSRTASVMAVAGILPVVGQLAIRSVAHGTLETNAFGCFQAGLSLAAVSVSVLAGSVGPSVFPRLSALAGDTDRFQRAIGWQVGIYLMLYAPIILAMEAVPELVVKVLLAPSFAATVDQLRWQLVGEVLRLPSWVLAAALTARGRFRAYLLVESVSLVVSVGLVALASPTHSLGLLGVALAGGSLAQFSTLWILLAADGVRVPSSTLLKVGAVAFGSAAAAALVVAVPPLRYGVLAAGMAGGVLAVRTVLRLRRGDTLHE